MSNTSRCVSVLWTMEEIIPTFQYHLLLGTFFSFFKLMNSVRLVTDHSFFSFSTEKFNAKFAFHLLLARTQDLMALIWIQTLSDYILFSFALISLFLSYCLYFCDLPQENKSEARLGYTNLPSFGFLFYSPCPFCAGPTLPCNGLSLHSDDRI